MCHVVDGFIREGHEIHRRKGTPIVFYWRSHDAHDSLECRWCFSRAECHLEELEESVVTSRRCFWSTVIINFNLAIPLIGSHISEKPRTSKRINTLVQRWKWIWSHICHRAAFAIMIARSGWANFFRHRYYRSGLFRVSQQDGSSWSNIFITFAAKCLAVNPAR